MTESRPKPKNERKSAGSGSWAVFVATGFGIGLLGKAPGTWGSLLALPLAWAIGMVPSLPLQATLIVGFCLASIPIATAAGRQLGRGKDPGCIVIDEIAGILITFFLVPISGLTVVVVGFLLFRLFDISKPPPARRLEHLPEGLGVMADDWAAAIYANLSLRLIVYLLPTWFT